MDTMKSKSTVFNQLQLLIYTIPPMLPSTKFSIILGFSHFLLAKSLIFAVFKAFYVQFSGFFLES